MGKFYKKTSEKVDKTEFDYYTKGRNVMPEMRITKGFFEICRKIGKFLLKMAKAGNL